MCEEITTEFSLLGNFTLEANGVKPLINHLFYTSCFTGFIGYIYSRDSQSPVWVSNHQFLPCLTELLFDIDRDGRLMLKPPPSLGRIKVLQRTDSEEKPKGGIVPRKMKKIFTTRLNDQRWRAQAGCSGRR